MYSKLNHACGMLIAKIDGFNKDERGVTAIEYGLIGMAMAVLVGALLTSNGDLIQAIKGAYEQMATAINSAGQTTAPTP